HRPGTAAWLPVAVAAFCCAATPAWAHTTERGFVLLLPTGHYIAGGTLAVAASFLVLAFVPGGLVRRIARARVALCTMPRIPTAVTSGVAAAALVLLLAAGLSGSRDPLRNPLPLTVWTLWWVGLTLAQALFGNLWSALNPWTGPYRALRRPDARAPLAYPDRLGYWPAIVGFLGFAWFELVDPAPDDPARLAVAVAAYWVATLAGMLLFGERAWMARGECFTVFLGFVARMAPLQVEDGGPETGGRRLVLVFPGTRLASLGALPVSGVLFVLLTLGTVSFDGLNKTFWWLDLGGINPLEFPGRSALVARNSLGLVAVWAALAIAYGSAILLGRRLARGGCGRRSLLGAFVLSILPISIGYHFAHYLTVFLVNAQYAVLALADPFARGWGLAGSDHRHVIVSFLANYDAVSLIWKLQVAGVVAGHVLAVLVAHIVAVETFGRARAAMAGERLLTALMIGYTLFGLWLLAAPTAG
ncbi:MAG TPA: hypothetical protein VK943_01155, partial [Arenibaculum sp.]|nr:hypothetical protein [Arenibaculum sp.]